MLVIGIIIIVLLVVSIPICIAETRATNKHTEIMKQQNVLLWAAVDQSKAFLAEALKEAEKLKAKTEEVKIDIDGQKVFKAVKDATRKRGNNL